MTQTSALINGLKKALRANGQTYAQVAKQLEMSEANIKRMFSEQRFSLEIFDRICDLAGLDILELARDVAASQQSIQQLTEAQESAIVEDDTLFFVAFLVIHRVTVAQIQSHYKMSYPDIVAALAKLDQLKIIELLPFDRVKLLVSPSFRWRPQGPIQMYFSRKLQVDFLDHQFTREGEYLTFLSGITTKKNREHFIEKLKSLAVEFSQAADSDGVQQFDQRQVTGIMLALRTWKPAAFKVFMK